ncbi:MAG: hypothetical protein K0R22_3498, partial [Sporomusa sp.]|nr:hypothetical protein [Sporomusa sp.]
QQELQTRLAGKANKLHSELSTELKTYAEQLEQEYQPQLFNLQLKLQTVRMDEKEAAAVKKALDDLKAEQTNKLTVREKELAQKLETALTPDKTASEQELATYAKQLHSEISNKMAAQTANIADKGTGPLSSSSTAAGVSALEQQFTMKQQEISALEDTILNDIRDKAAKVAIERNLDVVFTGQRVNVSAVDITDAVITAVKK